MVALDEPRIAQGISMFGNLRISFKLLVMVMLAFAGIMAVAMLGLVELKANLLEDRKAKLRDVVQLAVQNASQEYQDPITAGLTEQTATLRVKAALRGLRYGNNDYFLPMIKPVLFRSCRTRKPMVRRDGISRIRMGFPLCAN